MSNENNSAFPRPYDTHQDHCGLTKLEYFTAAAMQGHLMNPNIERISDDKIAVWSVAVAKATLSELSKEVGK